MFCRNNSQQITMMDPINTMPQYLKKILLKSWAHTFQEYIFPNIKEERFAVLYSDNHATRPNTPVNIIIGLLILKEIFGLTDEDLIGSLHFDTRFQYALRTTSFEQQPVSINTLTNFRTRLYNYEKETGIDLIKQEVEEQAEIIAKYLEIDNKKVRMDSFMVSSSCKKLSRIELVYSVNARFVKLLNKVAGDAIAEEYKAYLESGHKNETIYRTRDIESESKLEFLLKQAQGLHQAGSHIGETVTQTEEYQLLTRMLKEQLTQDETGKSIPKAGKEIAPDSLQNPTDPDATYRKKYGKNTGYVANVAESFNEKNSIITSYDLKPNTYSDSKFADDTISKLEETSSEKIQLIVDGAYYKQEKAENAASKGIELIPGELVGRKPATDKLSYSSFSIDEDKNVVNRCPNNQEPIEAYYDEKGKSYTAKFSKEQCQDCPHKDKCPMKEQKKDNVVRFSAKRYNTDLQRAKMDDAEYNKLVSQRAGVEGIPSVFRRKYQVDYMPVRGLVRSKFWFGFKVAAYNIKKLINRVSGLGLTSLSNLCSVHFKVFLPKGKWNFCSIRIA
ncbi:transposase [Desulfitibacter alkalitolerans]|uniref:transposase n=1 Tax=Desulfitibacter alkalitolerans TaxID=264641 RepID=UPI000684E14E|nr:transposase [Desulfitibacter alkalitolerans]